ncbi:MULTISPECIES: hypothetical protein [Bacillaceae]|uniref:Uncharacterized protein n=1 Tax=Alkalicoccobacillus plakortidis TaxID=444060 RepID=A0A9D5I160_9BACI|nr:MULTISPECIES: hypothetical protein [Bacillaceae]KQL57321.1 hypothetical protein AN965_07365 [Alkalicoccobacillus plakortidis]
MKIRLSFLVILPLVTALTLPTSMASENDPTEISPLACPEVNTYTTSYKSKTTSKKTEFTHISSNNSNSTDSVTRSVQISHSATVNVGGEVSFKVLQNGAKINANVGYGYNSSKTLSTTWSVPKGTWKLTAGSSWVKATGTRYRTVPPCNIADSKTVTANYTYATWSDKVKQ